MSEENVNEIDELEALVDEQEPEARPDDSALDYSRWAYSLAVVILDAVTALTIALLTTIWYYGAIWFCAGAVFFYLHHKNWERAGNNEKQMKNSVRGLIVSVASMVIMALAVGGLWIAQLNKALVSAMWVEIGIVGLSIVLFGWHALQVALFYFMDDGVKLRNTIARAKAQADKKVQIIEAGDSVLSAFKKAQNKRNDNYKKHGNRGAVDAAIRRVEGRNDERPRQQYPQQMTSYASEVKQERNPTPPPRE